jgi:Reverse transcriptase (RNA-dependent DNA polymerase)
LLNKHRVGFLAKKSTVTNLLESVNDWTLSVENSNDLVIAYIDLTRAFDSVSHEELVHKLEAYGITCKLLMWTSNICLTVRSVLK